MLAEDRRLAWAAVIVLAVFAFEGAWFLASHKASEYANSTQYSAHQHNSADQPASVSNRGYPKSTKGRGPDKDDKTDNFSDWADWFFGDMNRVIALGTLLLATGAFLQFELNRRTARRQLRAYLDIEGVQLDKHPDDPAGEWSVFIGRRNFGATPAEVTALAFEKLVGPRLDETKTIPFTENAERRADISMRFPPNHFHTAQLRLPEIVAGVAGWNRERRLAHRVYAWGHIEYRDAFKQRYYFHFQMRHTFEDVKQLGICRGGNKAGKISWYNRFLLKRHPRCCDGARRRDSRQPNG